MSSSLNRRNFIKASALTGAAVTLNNSIKAFSPQKKDKVRIGIIGAARSGLLAARDPDDETRRVLAVTKANLAERAPSLAPSSI